MFRNNKFINYSWPRNRHDFLVQKSINKPNQATIRNPEPTSDRTNLFGSRKIAWIFYLCFKIDSRPKQ